MSKNYGIKSSRENQDVLAFELEQGSVTSQYSTPKIKPNQTPKHVDVPTYTWGSNPAAGTYTLITIAHGYSYTPMQWSMMSHTIYTVGSFYRTLPVLFGGANSDLFYAYTDATNFYVKLKRVGTGATNISGSTLTVKYMIFAEDGV